MFIYPLSFSKIVITEKLVQIFTKNGTTFTQPVTKSVTHDKYTRREWIVDRTISSGDLLLPFGSSGSIVTQFGRWHAVDLEGAARSGKSIRGILRNLWNNMLVCFNYANAIQPKSASRRRVYRRTDRLRHRSGR